MIITNKWKQIYFLSQLIKPFSFWCWGMASETTLSLTLSPIAHLWLVWYTCVITNLFCVKECAQVGSCNIVECKIYCSRKHSQMHPGNLLASKVILD